MIGNWFEVRVNMDRTLENGQVAKVREDYLQQGLSVTEAENCIIGALMGECMGEFEVSSVKRVKIAEFFANETGETWHKAKVNFVTLDEKTGAEKRTASTMMVKAEDVKTAVMVLYEGMRGTASDWELVSISTTTVQNVFASEKEEEKD